MLQDHLGFLIPRFLELDLDFSAGKDDSAYSTYAPSTRADSKYRRLDSIINVKPEHHQAHFKMDDLEQQKNAITLPQRKRAETFSWSRVTVAVKDRTTKRLKNIVQDSNGVVRPGTYLQYVFKL